MRKFYVLLVATLFTTTSFAQAPTTGLAAQIPLKGQLAQLPSNARKTAFQLPDAANQTAAARVKKANGDLPLITEQPEGTLHANYYGSQTSLVQFWGMVYQDLMDGEAKNFVVSDDGSVYLQSALSAYASTAWIKGTRAEGDTIVFNFPQKYVGGTGVDEDGNPTDEDESFYLWRMVLTDAGNSLKIDDNSQTLKYVLRGDSLFRVETFDKDGVALGLCMADNQWMGYADLDCSWTKNTDAIVDDVPDGSMPEKYQFDFYNSDGQPDARLVNVIVHHDNMFINRLTDDISEGWVKGHIEGDKVVFRGKTYMGIDTNLNYHAYFSPVEYQDVEDPETGEVEQQLVFTDELALSYDPDAKTLESDGMVVVNAGKHQVATIAEFDGISIKPWTEVAGAPKDPEIIDFMNYDDGYGYGAMQIYLEHTSTDDILLTPEKLFFNLYFDGKPYTFTPEEYAGVEQSTTDMPVNFTNGDNLTSFGASRVLYFYESGFKTVAVQEVYKDGGKVYGSNYVNYTIDEDGNLVDGVKGASLVADEADVKSVSYTDLSGRSVAQPTAGIYLKTIKYADGTQKTVKFVKR